MISAARIRPGQACSEGAYRCIDCGYELRVAALPSMPPCPRSADLDHETNTWQRRRAGWGWFGLLAVGAVGVGALVHAVGARRLADEARRLAEHAEGFAERGSRSALRRARDLRSRI